MANGASQNPPRRTVAKPGPVAVRSCLHRQPIDDPDA
jgi:hypothetical protein